MSFVSVNHSISDRIPDRSLSSNQVELFLCDPSSTEDELETLMNADGSVSLVEYYTPSELSEVADDSSLCSSTLRSSGSRTLVTLDNNGVVESGNGEPDPPSASTSILKAEIRDRQEQEPLSHFQLIKQGKEEKGNLYGHCLISTTSIHRCWWFH